MPVWGGLGWVRRVRDSLGGYLEPCGSHVDARRRAPHACSLLASSFTNSLVNSLRTPRDDTEMDGLRPSSERGEKTTARR